MEGSYPIFIDGEPAGKLRVCAQGAVTVFEAQCRPVEGIVRISVYGQGREGCLGVLVPGEEGMVLRKKLSRTAMRDFPTEIELVERSGLDLSDCRSGEEVPATESECCPEPENEPECGRCQEQTGCDEPERGSGEGMDWYSSPDGVLVCFDGERSLVAFPLGDSRIPEGRPGEKRRIEGREYVVYITENGRLL